MPHNDPEDNFYEKVTTFADGQFRFHIDRSSGRLGWLKDWLSGSILQRSAAYNFIRNQVYAYWRERTISTETARARDDKVAFYNELLRAFAQDLKRRGIAFLFFAVNDHLGVWPGILAEVERLDREGLLHYLPSEPWFAGVSDYGTPEGHDWGAKGHAIVAAHLSQPLRELLAAHNSASGHQAIPRAYVRGNRSFKDFRKNDVMVKQRIQLLLYLFKSIPFERRRSFLKIYTCLLLGRDTCRRAAAGYMPYR